jgi:exonuclease SbcD
VQALLPRALEVRIDAGSLPELDAGAPRPTRTGRSPEELFGEYLADRGVVDPAVTQLFHRFYEEVLS